MRKILSYCYAFTSTTVIHTRLLSYTLEQMVVFGISAVALFLIPTAVLFFFNLLNEYTSTILFFAPWVITYYLTVSLERDGMPLMDWAISEKDYWQMPDEFEPFTFEACEEGEMELIWRKGERS
ncbi:hypothetical protein GCM10011571_33430 [Marinithermofilum abyssi]|uniref:Uncharacterized protein n=1 Tax=Marinithermofilum abyssi TaxID=1571185 RepID=A0A8J2VJS3_9BACL|nr:hypothetical protein [Marinithermofilum abyssi]GGE28645.1 hypothetical protein GCM10011571_33430 [Marinithermofilum abyssi]